MRATAALAAVLLLSACGGHKQHSSAERTAVAQYIDRVDAIETEMEAPLRSVAIATSAYKHGAPPSQTAPAFARSEGTLLDLYSRLIFVTPPRAARHLSALIAQLVQRQASLAGELHALVVFNPAFAQALQPLAAANATARRRLAGTKNRVRIARAVHEYRLSIAAVDRSIQGLHPPDVERPLYEGQKARLAALIASLANLERAVRANDPRAAVQFQHDVAVASVSSDTHARQVAERNAVVTYNARVASIQTLARRVAQERNRLQTTLP